MTLPERHRDNKIRIPHIFSLILLWVLLISVFSGCVAPGEGELPDDDRVFTPVPTNAPIATIPPDFDDPKPGGTLSVAVDMTDTVNPLFTTSEEIKYCSKLIYERFVNVSNSGEVLPGLAVYWESTDNKTWHFVLKEDVKWHDGTDFKAADVIETLEAIEVRGGLFSGTLENVSKFYKEEDRDIYIVLKEPDPMALYKMSFPVVKNPTEKTPDMISGTGAYMYDRTEGDSVYFTVYPDYQGEKPYYQNLKFNMYRTEKEKYASKDDLMFIKGRNMSIYSARAGYSTYKYQGRTFTCLVPSLKGYTREYDYYTGEYLYTDSNVCETPRGREAIYYCINRTKLINKVLSGNGTQYSWPVQSSYLPSFGEGRTYSQNLDKAYELFEQCGFTFSPGEKKWYLDKAKQHPIKINIVVPENSSEFTFIAQSLKEDFEAAGLSVSLYPANEETYARYLESSVYTFVMMSFEMGDVSSLREIFVKDGKYNFNYFNDPEINNLFDILSRMTGEDDINNVCEWIESNLWERLPILGLYTETEGVMISQKVGGVADSIFGVMDPLESFNSWYSLERS